MLGSDLAVAQAAAARLVACGRGRVRRVLLIGSRARGDARPGSDLDLAVVLEQAVHEKPWGPLDLAAERTRLGAQFAAGSKPLIDITATTTEMYAAGRAVFGGVEWLIDHEGVEVYSSAPRRKPVVQRTRDQVRRGYTATWIDHAIRALHAALRPASRRDADAAAFASVERAIAALLVHYQIPTGKLTGTSGMLDLLRCVDAGLTEWIEGVIGPGVTARVAHTVLKGAVERISLEAESRPYVAGAREFLTKL